MKIIALEQIQKIIEHVDIIPAIEQGFIAYSQNQAVIPPIGEMFFDNPPGELHIKYGYLKSDDYYVVKIASGFHDNYKLNLPSSNGIMLLFDKKNGELLSILLDDCYLTNIRTAAAGAIAAKYLAPKKIKVIGIIGAGVQAWLQLLFLKQITDCKNVVIWNRSQEKSIEFKNKAIMHHYNVEITSSISELTKQCNLIITTTPSKQPLIKEHDVLPGTHITAVGADTSEKQELDTSVFKKADIVVADSIEQCKSRGEIAHALKKKIITEKNILELGNIIASGQKARISEAQITICDLTGVAVQDIQIAKLVYERAKQ